MEISDKILDFMPSLCVRYHDMVRRCHNPKAESYKHYGERGIQVCDEWRGEHGFSNFVKHVIMLEHCGEKGYTLDRIDVNGNYEPGNVRWANSKLQVKNRRCTVLLDGKSVSEIAEEMGMSYQAAYDFVIRKRNNIPKTFRMVRDNGQILNEISKETGIALNVLIWRYVAGDRGDRLRRPLRTKKDAYSQELTRSKTTE